MNNYLTEIAGQSIKDYFWPNTDSDLGAKTALYEGSAASLILALIYSVITIKLLIFGVAPPPELEELLSHELIDNDIYNMKIYTDLKILFSLLAAGSAFYYIYSIGSKKSKISIVFLLIWTVFEVFSEFSNGPTILITLYLLLFLGALNCYRTIR